MIDHAKFIGNVYGSLQVIGIGKTNKHRKKELIVQCLNHPNIIFSVVKQSLVNGSTIGCVECKRDRNTKHGMWKTPEYRSWITMHQRCYNTNNPGYRNYGGRGIKVEWEWHKNNPDGFVNFLRDKGPITNPEKNTNDRFDNDANYGPKNDNGWQDRETQGQNRSTNKINSIEEAEFIRDLYFNKKVSIRNIAEFFRCSELTIQAIINDISWLT